jgi:LacI family transcriptional regulator
MTRAQTASIKAVAAKAGVSIATVSRVVNGVAKKASPETVARVREAIAALDYRPASAGRALRQQRSRMVAVLAANLANPTMAAIAASAETALREHGLVMVLCDTHDRPDLQDEYLREMQAHQVRAIILLAAVESPMLAAMRDGETPLVFVNRRDPGRGRASRYVGIDNLAAGREVARHCIEAGAASVALIHGATTSSATSDRVKGILAGFEAAGRPLPASAVIPPVDADHLLIGQAGARALLAAGQRPDALICTSDLIAFGARRAFLDGKAAMPRFIGFDDSPMNEWVAPWLTSVRIPYASYGTAIVSLLAGSPDKPALVSIQPFQLIER